MSIDARPGTTTVAVTATVNGRPESRRVPARTLLVHLLREELGLTAATVGCDTSSCGACTVLFDGRSVKSCTLLAAQADGADIRTAEGLADGDRLHPVQEAFREHHALQCGFCTPGMVLAVVSLLTENPGPLTEHDVRHALKGNLCRCTGYHNIVRAVLALDEARQAG
ncbi:(2Fe-2S)-binding protein [Micromonospora sp. NPDC047557]|uniref:(2Fe-2S)-binding protein n=1 Tax=Micromonospora sp. NPDC047557 TaxID=3364250 RepID=UPI003710AC19